MVSYLPSSGPADVPAMLNTLVARRCRVIVVTGASQTQVTNAAKANPGRHFILVTTKTPAGSAAMPSNTVVVPAANASGRIHQEVTALAGTA
jgi:basic membrane lipoprotein Med (substrate-binding protein (PBP1-ABC) superfamily)